MPLARESPIPDIRIRTDNSETAREWNKMREAVLSIHASGTEPIVIPRPRLPRGFEPVAQVKESSSDAGVGMAQGSLRFLESSSIYEASGARNKSVEVMPTLGGIALDAAIPPREFLERGDYEAWVVFKELGDDHEAVIKFVTLDAGPGTLDRDEKAERLATFEVYYPDGSLGQEGEAPGVRLIEQFIYDELAIWTERHQFKVRKTDDDKIKVDQGFVVWQKGPSDPLVSESFDIDESAEITIPGASGSIWLSMSWQVAQHSTSTASSGTVLTNYRLDSLSSAAYSFRVAAPARGVDTGGIFYTGTLWYEIAKVEIVGGDAFVTDQIINGPIYVNELSDSFLS